MFKKSTERDYDDALMEMSIKFNSDRDQCYCYSPPPGAQDRVLIAIDSSRNSTASEALSFNIAPNSN